MNTEVMFSSKTDDWATPLDFFKELDKEFHFDLDPCSDQFNHKCERFFTKAENGLEQSWGGSKVFCNPPYGREISKWVQKSFEESQKPNTLVVMLIPVRTDTAYFHDYIYGKAEVRFVRGRLKFGDSKNSAPFPSMVVIYRSKQFRSEWLDSLLEQGGHVNDCRRKDKARASEARVLGATTLGEIRDCSLHNLPVGEQPAQPL